MAIEYGRSMRGVAYTCVLIYKCCYTYIQLYVYTHMYTYTYVYVYIHELLGSSSACFHAEILISCSSSAFYPALKASVQCWGLKQD